MARKNHTNFIASVDKQIRPPTSPPLAKNVWKFTDIHFIWLEISKIDENAPFLFSLFIFRQLTLFWAPQKKNNET